MNMELEQMGGICSIGQCYLKEKMNDENRWLTVIIKLFKLYFYFEPHQIILSLCIY